LLHVLPASKQEQKMMALSDMNQERRELWTTAEDDERRKVALMCPSSY
jgi:hypothetical protein